MELATPLLLAFAGLWVVGLYVLAETCAETLRERWREQTRERRGHGRTSTRVQVLRDCVAEGGVVQTREGRGGGTQLMQGVVAGGAIVQVG